MKQYFAGLITGIFFIISAIAFMGAHNDIRNYGKYQFTSIVEKNTDGQEFTAHYMIDTESGKLFAMTSTSNNNWKMIGGN